MLFDSRPRSLVKSDTAQHQWTFDDIGNRLTEKRKAATGDTTYTHTHPASGAGSMRPHTVTNVTATGAASWSRNYTYDNAGNTTTRPTATGATQTLTFDPEGKLATQTEGANTTGYLYDADGNRLIRTDPGGSKTLYLPDGTQIRYDQPTNTRKATRYYTHAGATIAVRTAAGLNWIIADHHGTAECTINATTLTVAKRRTLPYGEQRGTTTGTWPNTMDKGFVGGTKDPTGLTHLGAREYDPTIGRFISVDPITDPTDPQQIHGYAYATTTPPPPPTPTADASASKTGTRPASAAPIGTSGNASSNRSSRPGTSNFSGGRPKEAMSVGGWGNAGDYPDRTR